MTGITDPLERKMVRKSYIGLALGGGGARGLAHIGVLKVLIRERIPIDIITGSSMGAVVGGAYALLQDLERIERAALSLPEKIPQLEELKNVHQIPRYQKHSISRLINFIKEIYILNVEATRKSLVENETVLSVLEEVFDQKTFADLSLPFGAVATDLCSGEEVLLREGLLSEAILASMAIPGIFEPVKKNGKILVDGGVTSEVPVQATRAMGADFVIAVNVKGDILRRTFDRGIDILFQVDEIRGAELNRIQLAAADLVINPLISHINWSQFSKVKECIRRGEEATIRMLSQIQNSLKKYRRRGLSRFLLPFGR